MIFNVSVTGLINVILIAAGIGVCGLCFMHISGARHLRKEIRNYFQVFFSLIVFYISAHLVRQLMNGIPGNGVHTALYIVTFAEMLAAGFMAYMMSLLILSTARPEKTIMKRYLAVLGAFLLLHVLTLSFGQIGASIFSFDKSNVYHRSSLYLLSNAGPVLMLITDVVMLIRYGGKMTKLVKVGFWNYIIAPIIAIILHVYPYIPLTETSPA